MSKGPENTFIASVHRHLPDEVYRMKNHNEYMGGVADVWYSAKGANCDLWVEYKFISVPVRDTTIIDITAGKKPELSALQQQWLSARCAEGRNVGILIGCKAGGVWFPGVTGMHPITAKDFRAQLQIRSQLAALIHQLVRH